MDALTGTLKLSVRRLVGGLYLVIVSLRENLVLEEQLGAGESAVGALHFDLRLLVVGPRESDVAALECGDNVTFPYLLAWKHAKSQYPSTGWREDANDMRRVSGDVSGNFEIVAALLGMRDSGLDACICGLHGFYRRGCGGLARRKRQGGERQQNKGISCFHSCLHGRMSVAAA